MVYQNRSIVHFQESIEKLEEKEQNTIDLRYSFNLAISEMRAYYAYSGVETYYQNVEKEKDIVKEKMAAFQGLVENEEDLKMLEETEEFYAYYFYDILPRTKAYFLAGQIDEVVNIAVNENASENIRVYQDILKAYTDNLREQLKKQNEILAEEIFYSQILFAITSSLFMLSLVLFIRVVLRKIGVPLKNLTAAAGEIADGHNIPFIGSTKRNDELGVLSRAFEKMSRSIQDKERFLSDQNEELVTQQEVLQKNQIELEEALKVTKIRELDLKKRNDLINGTANSLNKQVVISSIVKTMCDVIDADKGILVLLNRDFDYTSLGVSDEGVEQFRKRLRSGLIKRLKETKKPFTIKRESILEEKGYHTELTYTYDFYLPVLAPTSNIEAVMMFSRSRAFSMEERTEYESISKQIAISLENIKLFEQSEEERLQTQGILDTIKEGIQLVDVFGNVIQVNQKLSDMLGIPAETFLHQPYEKWSKEIIETVKNGSVLQQFFRSILFENQPEQTSFIYEQEKPIQRVVQIYCEPLTRNGEKFGTVVVHRDITKEYEVDKMKSEFVSTVSHELRTPLASVLGFTELMLNKEIKPERQKKYLTTIYYEAKRLTDLINDFLDVQRMEAGKQTYSKKYDDLLPLLKNLLETFELNHTKHNFSLNVRTDHTIVLGDKDKIFQVFQNLISNAVKYSPNGGKIVITVLEEETNLKIEIKDEGLGIPEDALEKLFTKFFRVDNSDRRKIGGTGLGLAIVKKIMEDHNGGDVTVESVLNEGCTFTVCFPLVIGRKKELYDENSNQNSDGKVNVIIVEDDQNLAELLKTELEESAFHVKVYNEGESALAAIKTEQPDAVVLDIMLEENAINGWDMIKELKQMDEFKSIPIFISSALDEKEKAISLGAENYFVKPYQPSTLSKLILQTLLQKDWSGQILIPSEED